MIYTYGITQQGTYHVKEGIVCQDSHQIIKVDDKTVIAAVADGLGSEKYSDIASSLAARLSVEHCRDNIKEGMSDEELLSVISDAFTVALASIEVKAAEDGNDLDQYDTTLSLAYFRDGTLYYGHSGDSGIIALTAEGLYKNVTTQQRDGYNCVYPLCFGEDKWVFEKFPDRVSAVLLATDGVYESFFPLHLKNEPVNIYISLASYLMDKDRLKIEEKGEQAVTEKISRYFASIPDAQINDDKTVVVLINSDIEASRQPDEYYVEPDWEALKRKYEDNWRRQAYPEMYKNENGSEQQKAENAPQENAQPSAEKAEAVQPSAEAAQEKTPEAEKTAESPDTCTEAPVGAEKPCPDTGCTCCTDKDKVQEQSSTDNDITDDGAAKTDGTADKPENTVASLTEKAEKAAQIIAEKAEKAAEKAEALAENVEKTVETIAENAEKAAEKAEAIAEKAGETTAEKAGELSEAVKNVFKLSHKAINEHFKSAKKFFTGKSEKKDDKRGE